MKPICFLVASSALRSWKSGAAAWCRASPSCDVSAMRVNLHEASLGKTFRRQRRYATDGDDFSARIYIGCNLLESFGGDTISGRENEDWVVDAEVVDSVGIDEVEVIAGAENGGSERRCDEPGHGSTYADLARGKAGPCVIGWEKNSDLI